MSVPGFPVAAHAATTRSPSAASVTCALARSGMASSIPSETGLRRAHAAASVAASRRATVFLRMSELRSHAELEGTRLADSRDLAEGRRWIGRVRARAEIAVQRDDVRPVGEIETLDEAFDPQAI